MALGLVMRFEPHAGGALSRTRMQGAPHAVPKTLGVAQCAGCGARSFFRACGVQLSPCERGCNQVGWQAAVCFRLCAARWCAHHNIPPGCGSAGCATPTLAGCGASRQRVRQDGRQWRACQRSEGA